jgi:hypothetical protein
MVIHVVSTSRSSGAGRLTDQDIGRQVEVLNKAFAPSQFTFFLQNITRIYSSLSDVEMSEAWVNGTLRKVTHQGNFATLNVVILDHTIDVNGATGSTGACTLPNPYSIDQDGCVINYKTVPRNSLFKFPISGSGKILVHGVGHWLGLPHTFQEARNSENGSEPVSCTSGAEHGDGILDTPVHLLPLPHRRLDSRCIPMNSCPHFPGNDPVHNYLNYMHENCWKEFTEGQKTKMHQVWNDRVRVSLSPYWDNSPPG